MEKYEIVIMMIPSPRDAIHAVLKIYIILTNFPIYKNFHY